jgi:hypothetical protein
LISALKKGSYRGSRPSLCLMGNWPFGLLSG